MNCVMDRMGRQNGENKNRFVKAHSVDIKAKIKVWVKVITTWSFKWYNLTVQPHSIGFKTYGIQRFTFQQRNIEVELSSERGERDTFT